MNEPMINAVIIRLAKNIAPTIIAPMMMLKEVGKFPFSISAFPPSCPVVWLDNYSQDYGCDQGVDSDGFSQGSD